jgi:hypothetical protein
MKKHLYFSKVKKVEDGGYKSIAAMKANKNTLVTT